MESSPGSVKKEPIEASIASEKDDKSETAPFSLPQKRYSGEEEGFAVEGAGSLNESQMNTAGQETIVTFWHVFTVILCFIGHFMEAFGSHGLSSLVAKDYSEGRGSLVLLSITASVPVVFTLTLLPQCIYLFHKSPVIYRFSAAIGFFLIALSFIASAVVPTHLLYLVTYSLPFGAGSAFLLAATSQLSHGYFPSNYPYRFIINICIALGFPLGAATGPVVYAHFLYGSGKNYFRKLFWFFVCMAVTNLLLGILAAILAKPKEQTLCSALQELQPSADKFEDEDKSKFGWKSSSRHAMQKPCSAYFQLLLIFERNLMFFWLLSEIFCGALWFALRVCLMVYIMKNYPVKLRAAATFLCVFAIGQGCVIMVATLLGSRLRRALPLIHLISSLGLCILSAFIIYLPLSRVALYLCVFCLGVFTQLSLSFSYSNAEKLMKIGFGNSFVITASALGLGVLLSVLVGGLIVIHPPEPRLFFFIQLGGWGFTTMLHSILCGTYYISKWCR